MKDIIFGVIGVVGGMLLAFLLKNKNKQINTSKPIEEIIDNEALLKQIYDKNPPLRSKEDVLKELNRHLHDN